ncbi:hypothetical protein DL96DRAFT_1472419 [Flagelloscypha sp. PMI_526]|nr:hypothetical protein DL96DRAFT_1472419 [Flagelloscypha sp. PMI_526]
MLWSLFSLISVFLVRLIFAGPAVSLVSNTKPDSSGIYFVSYDGLVNVNSFQLSGVLTYGSYQYVGWWTSTGYAKLGRRSVNGTSWSTIQLNHVLTSSDSHRVIALGVSPEDGRIHVAMDCHSDTQYYTVSTSGLASGGTWSNSSFGSITTTLGNLNIGTVVTYPQFVVTPNNLLQFFYRTGVSGNGATQLAEYSGGTWTNVGSWASASGSYTSPPTSAVSTARNLYIHGATYQGSRLHITGTWRETNAAVSCSTGGLTNHDTVYFYSDDRGRTWKNSAGTSVGTSGSSPVNVNSAGIIVDSLDANHGLMNQESQVVDTSGLIHAIISYMPGRFGQCVTNYESDRIAHGYAFHVYKNSSGLFTKNEITNWPIAAVGRSQIVLDKSNNAYVVLPYLKIVSATASSKWTDWTLAYDGQAQGLNVFGEVTVDRERLRIGDGVLSVLYQESSSGTTPSPVHVADFKLG